MSRQNDDRSYRLKYFNQIEAKAVSWLWYPYFPAGKFTIVQGDPGEGKTTMMLQLAALLTQGKKLPDGTELSGAVNVIFQGAEDGVSDTIKPRLIQAGADCSRIAFIDPEEDRSLSLGDRRFERAMNTSYQPDEPTSYGKESSAFAYTENWSCSETAQKYLRRKREEVISSVTKDDICQCGTVMENPMIGELPSKQEILRELDELLMTM